MRRLCVALLLVLGAVAPPTRVRADEGKVTLEIRPDETVAARGQATGIEVVAVIARGWHINAHKPTEPFLKPTVLTLTVSEGASADAVNYPVPEKHKFAFAGDAELLVYQGKLGLTSAVRVDPGFRGDRVQVTAELQYQACDDTSCLRPTRVTASLELPVRDGAGAGAGSDPVDGSPVAGDESTVIGRWLAERGLFFTLAAVALLGLGLNLTPCVYPLISVTIAYFGGQGRHRRAVAGLAVLYVLGIALSFSAVGLAAALSGGLFGAALQKPPVLLFIAGVMIALALASFGLYQLQPPAGVMRWAGHTGTGAAGAVFMGLTMGIVAAPCIGPIVVGLLIFVGSRQDPSLGFLLFFVLAIGMGAPYLVLAMAAGSIRELPRSGEWLVWIERLFGCVLLSLAAYYLVPLVPPTARPWLVPVVIASSGLYLGFVSRAGGRVPYFPFIRAAVGLAMIAAAIWIALPASAPHAIAWESYPEWANRSAAGVSKPLLLDFGAEWCIPCREMEHTTYVDPGVVAEADRFHMVKADITEENDSTAELVAKYDVKGVPTVILFSPDGDERQRMVGYVAPERLLSAMRSIRSTQP
jgi:thiol:disulfide interchange protein DsbD